jgi:hypothetical protein
MIKHGRISSNRRVPCVTYYDYYSGSKDADCLRADYEPTFSNT